MRRRLTRGRRRAKTSPPTPGRRLIALAIGAALAFGALGLASASASPPAQFRWLVPAPAPSGWKQATPPSGVALMSYPPSLVRLKSDSASVSVARKDRSGRILVYLNSTPKEGNQEQLATWPTFRLQHDRAEDDRVRLHAQAVGLRFLGGTGSCVIDDYYTRVKVNHYQEIACFVQGRTAASVIVAAALQSEWARAAPLLERAISAYRAI